MQFANVQFSKVIKIGERLREFNFRKVPNTNNSFHVDVTDERGSRVMFTLTKDEQNCWHASEPLPLWLEASVPVLTEAIEKEL